MGFEEKLDISDMKKCATNFEKTLAYAIHNEMQLQISVESEDDESLFMYQLVRSAVIHVFETTIEAAWKIMQRWVKINADINITHKPKRELFRIARDSNLISDAEKWWIFFEGRNRTSHTYKEEIAEEIYSLAKDFKDHLKDFIKRLEERL